MRSKTYSFWLKLVLILYFVYNKDMEIKNSRNLASSIYQDALAIRRAVFISEQGVAESIEIDENEDRCLHFVLYVDEKALATARLFEQDEKTVILQRMAVSKEARGKGYGRDLLLSIIQVAKEQDYHSLEAHAQISALDFYRSLGFDTQGPVYTEADILHQNIVLALNH